MIQVIAMVAVLVCIPVCGYGVYLARRGARVARLHARVSEWYGTHELGEPKPGYVLESERLRKKHAFEEGDG